ncbi:MSH2 protein, partial [Basidiobolus ranarum]
MAASTKDRPTLELDNKSETGFCQFYRSLGDANPGVIRVFERNGGDFYSIHGEDALYVAREIYKTSSVIKYLGAGEGLPSCTLSKLNTETFLRDGLMTKQLRFEIWIPDKKSTFGWKLGKKASPGNLQDVEDLLFVNNEISTSPVVLSAKVTQKDGQKLVGVAFADTTVRELGVCEFVDNELFSNFESLVIQLGVKECLVPESDKSNSYEIGKLTSVLNRCSVVITECKKAYYQIKDVEQDLNRLLDEEVPVTSMPEFELKHAMGSAACIIKYLSLLNDDTNFGNYTLRQHDLSQYMKLDASALRALNLMPGIQDGYNKTMSVFGVLNKCKTAQGTRLLAQWLKQPLLDIKEIEQRQLLVEVFTESNELRQSLQEEHLCKVPDLHRLAKRFQRGSAHLQDVVRIYQVLIRLPGLLALLENTEFPEVEHKELVDKIYTTKLKGYAEDLTKLQEMIETTIDLDRVDYHEYVIKPDFDDTLKDLREKLDKIMAGIPLEHERISANLGLEIEKKLKLEKSTMYGYCFRVTRTEASVLRNKSSQCIELSTQRSGVLFTTPKMREMSDKIRDLSEEYDRTQSALVKEVIGIVASYFPILEVLNGMLAHLDVLVSFAHVSAHAPIPYVKPKLFPKGQGNLTLRNSRHPCLEMQDDVSFIPNDVEIVRKDSEFQIITGPNMGGKSTYIRQIGVVVLMAQIGCFVPCDEAEVPIFDCILARVGAGDSQLKGVSTFMAEMLEPASSLKSASRDSLIIVHVLGRGTSTSDGFGLAGAISEE